MLMHLRGSLFPLNHTARHLSSFSRTLLLSCNAPLFLWISHKNSVSCATGRHKSPP